MKVRIINKELANFDEEYRVKNMNFDMVLVEDHDEKIYFHQEDVQIIPENSYEDAILRCKDIIKIKLHRGISLRFYTAVLDILREKLGEEVVSINLLRDEYRVIKKGLWEKLMLMIINEKHSILLSVIGRNYGNHFDITVKDYTLRAFVDECSAEIECLTKEIKDRELLIERYRQGMKDVIENNCVCNQRPLLPEAQKDNLNLYNT